MKYSSHVATILTACMVTAAHAQPWGEPHIPYVARTDAEAQRIRDVTKTSENTDTPEPFEARSGGAGTYLGEHGDHPFSHPSANLPDTDKLDFTLGEAFFEKLWVVAPASTISSDGLGPLYNARACSACHINDGRGVPPVDVDDPTPSLVLRLSVPATTSAEFAAPEPNYGFQTQDKAITGHPAEAQLDVTYTPKIVTLGDGTKVELRAPTYTPRVPDTRPLDEHVQTSPRIAPQMIGLGLLEAIPEADILALADPDDANDDGISGRPNRVWSREFNQWMLGRFGHKAGNPTLRQQSADAANGDIGLSSSLFPNAWGDCTETQQICRTAPHGNTPQQNDAELGDPALDLLTLYVQNLAVPARRNVNDPQVLGGKNIFNSIGCADCHQPKFVTHRLTDTPAQSFQLIWPYSDMLLHDMGEGLADQRPEWQADGQEWRTAPLWGIGLTAQTSGRATYLHDGRARSLLEAILWHDGEAKTAKETVRMMDPSDRAALIAFLESL